MSDVLTTQARWAYYPTAPLPPCVKCGHPYGFINARPTYRGPVDPPPAGTEYLEWSCQFCGFTIRTAVCG